MHRSSVLRYFPDEAQCASLAVRRFVSTVDGVGSGVGAGDGLGTSGTGAGTGTAEGMGAATGRACAQEHRAVYEWMSDAGEGKQSALRPDRQALQQPRLTRFTSEGGSA